MNDRTNRKNKMIVKEDGSKELEKIPIYAGDCIFIQYPKEHKPCIKIIKNVIPC